ncbi:hypothetical protein [Frondihabitans sp. 762G35]|uniref:hypothetical protein n=1 Tax=Frondihabitans sp. 762G35 TaxID=1446794 RepID=UPI000E706AE0|nr:hypothetical protein [Frondihabitans sp. 762G35]
MVLVKRPVDERDRVFEGDLQQGLPKGVPRIDGPGRAASDDLPGVPHHAHAADASEPGRIGRHGHDDRRFPLAEPRPELGERGDAGEAPADAHRYEPRIGRGKRRVPAPPRAAQATVSHGARQLAIAGAGRRQVALVEEAGAELGHEIDERVHADSVVSW